LLGRFSFVEISTTITVFPWWPDNLMTQDNSTKPMSALLETNSHHAVDEVLDYAVSRGERWMSIARILFSLASFASITVGKWFWTGERLSSRGWLTVSMGACLIAFSLWLIGRTLRGRIPRWLLGLSVTADATHVFHCLAGERALAL
jgi:hypothetical protein